MTPLAFNSSTPQLLKLKHDNTLSFKLCLLWFKINLRPFTSSDFAANGGANEGGDAVMDYVRDLDLASSAGHGAPHTSSLDSLC